MRIPLWEITSEALLKLVAQWDSAREWLEAAALLVGEVHTDLVAVLTIQVAVLTILVAALTILVAVAIILVAALTILVAVVTIPAAVLTIPVAVLTILVAALTILVAVITIPVAVATILVAVITILVAAATTLVEITGLVGPMYVLTMLIAIGTQIAHLEVRAQPGITQTPIAIGVIKTYTQTMAMAMVKLLDLHITRVVALTGITITITTTIMDGTSVSALPPILTGGQPLSQSMGPAIGFSTK
jgi:hypothetical protein